MNIKNCQIDTSVNAFIFDCDGTLSTIEGIEVLAQQNGVGERVKELTQYAMCEVGLCGDIYRERLDLVRPTRSQTVELAQHYFAARVPDITAIIETLQALGKAVYVVSAGVNPAVTLFATMLGVAPDNVFAVNLKFSPGGDYESYDETAYPSQHNGKRIIADELKARHDTLLWIGDGMNDLVVKPDVLRFVGYGGAFYRPKIAAAADFYLKCQSMAPLLALGLTTAECDSLSTTARELYENGLRYIECDDVECRV